MANNNEPIKPGWKTTEFWLTLVTAFSGLAVLFGYVTPEEGSAITGGIMQVIGGVVSVATVFGYTLSRGKVKQNSG